MQRAVLLLCAGVREELEADGGDGAAEALAEHPAARGHQSGERAAGIGLWGDESQGGVEADLEGVMEQWV